MDPVTLLSLEQIERQRLYAYAAGTCLLVYDYLLTLSTEVNYVWGTKWTPGKVLFFVLRYLAFIDVPLMLWEDTAIQTSRSACTVIVYLAICSTCAAYTLAGVVIGLRTWAIWNRSRTFGVLLVTSWACMIIIAGYYGIVSLLGVTVDADLPIGGCGALDNAAATQALVKVYVAISAYETIVFVATLVKGIHYARVGWPTLTFVLYRDAFLASSAVLAITIVTAALTGVFNYSFYDSYFIGRVLSSVLPARIILNLREASLAVDAWDAGTAVPMVTDTSFALADVDNGRSAVWEHS